MLAEHQNAEYILSCKAKYQNASHIEIGTKMSAGY